MSVDGSKSEANALPAATERAVRRYETRKTREAALQRIGDAQLPDILLEIDAATLFSEELLARRASSADELLALYGALWAHGTDNHAKGVGTMVPGIDVAQIAVAMGAPEQLGRLRRTNECVTQFQGRVPIAALWGDGNKGSANIIALDFAASVRTGRISADVGLRLCGSAAGPDPTRRAA